jgi:hypothetical protein
MVYKAKIVKCLQLVNISFAPRFYWHIFGIPVANNTRFCLLCGKPVKTMRVDVSYLNSVNLRSADKPYSTDFAGYRYVRRYLKGDTLRVQLVVSELAGVLNAEAQVQNSLGAPVKTLATTSSIRGSYSVLDIVVSGLDVGPYFLRVQLKDTATNTYIVLGSEPFCVVDGFKGKSVLVEVLNSANDFSVFFDTVEQPFAYRVEGGVTQKACSWRATTRYTKSSRRSLKCFTLFRMKRAGYCLAVAGVFPMSWRGSSTARSPATG